MEVTAPVLVVKSKLGTALTAASLLAAPFTGGASLAAGAAARGAMVGVQGARAGIAGIKARQASKGLGAAKEASNVANTARARGAYRKQGQAQSMADVSGGKTTQLSDFADIGDVTEGAGAKVGVTEPAKGGSYFDNISERGADGQMGSGSDAYQTTLDVDNVKQPNGSFANQQGTLSAQQNVDATQARANEMNEKLQETQKNYKESADMNTPIGAASAVGAYGFNQMEQHKKQNEANQKAEMERIEGLAESARAKASTGTGGKVAVA